MSGMFGIHSSWHIVQQMEYESLSWRGIICFGTIPHMRYTNWTFGFAHVLFLQPMKINTETPKKRIAIRNELISFKNHRTNLQPSKSFQICLSESRMPLNPLVNHCFQYKHAINREYNPSFSDPKKSYKFFNQKISQSYVHSYPYEWTSTQD